jgi:casein kinase 1
MTGFTDLKKLYLIDFGVSKFYKDEETGEHLPMITGKTLVGTPRFASINSHSGLELSRRDDLISILYMLVYLYKGDLPW